VIRVLQQGGTNLLVFIATLGRWQAALVTLVTVRGDITMLIATEDYSNLYILKY
jgi:hypothetical protein